MYYINTLKVYECSCEKINVIPANVNVFFAFFNTCYQVQIQKNLISKLREKSRMVHFEFENGPLTAF